MKYDTFNCTVPKGQCIGKCSECSNGEKIRLWDGKTYNLSSCVDSKTGIRFYYYGKLYAWVRAGEVIVRHRNSKPVSKQEYHSMLSGIQRYLSIQDKLNGVEHDIHSLYDSEALRHAELMACQG
jgi:hypothetical protein